MTRPRSRLSRAGQIVIPAMLIFPTLFLFVYLIYETAKLSREKIRHQFAMDAAAFVEMANYSDFLNRSAYVNGAFPMRIFEEGYAGFPADCAGKVANCQQKSYASILFDNGAFPHLGGQYIDGHTPETSATFTGKTSWTIEYGYNSDGSPTSIAPQSNRTTMNENPPQSVEPFVLFSLNDANHFWHSYQLATEIYKLWYQVYSLLGSVEDAQYQVLTRLTGGPPPHSFLQKSYWLNTGDSPNDAAQLATTFGNQLGNFNGAVGVLCQQTLLYCGNQHLGGTGLQPYRPECANPVIQLQSSAGCGGDMSGGSGGLFQLVYVKQQMISNLNTPHGGGNYPGLSLMMNWTYPSSNYFNVNWGQEFGSAGPQLHTTISLSGDPKNAPAVWPDPTPLFQVRQFP